jgi:serine/threonine-protein kinase RsbW
MLRTVLHATVARLGLLKGRVQHRHVIGTSAQPHSNGVVHFPRPDPHDGAIELTLPAHAENIALVRHLLRCIGACLQLESELVEDVRLAVTEACTNVVRHAYEEDSRGTMAVHVTPLDEAVRVVVADRGRGLGPSSDTRGPGLGLPLIAAIADSLHIDQAPGAGSRVIMTFARRREEAAA